MKHLGTYEVRDAWIGVLYGLGLELLLDGGVGETGGGLRKLLVYVNLTILDLSKYFEFLFSI